jgi:hypothetical protein
VISILGGLAIAGGLLGASTASAATLVRDYQFQGTRDSSVPGGPLIDVSGSNSFQPDTVMGVPRQVLAFPQASGVQISPTGLGGSTSPVYSAVATFRLDTVAGYERILDPSDGTNDLGYYIHDGKARYVGSAGVDPSNVVFADSVYATVAITSQPSPARTRFYVNGSLQFDDPSTEPVIADTLRFFKDNVTGASTGEESAGAVSCVRIYSGVLSDAEVGGIGASPTCGTLTPPSTPTAKKKCKKHKKKHRSAESAKKKCKKHKKR